MTAMGAPPGPIRCLMGTGAGGVPGAGNGGRPAGAVAQVGGVEVGGGNREGAGGGAAVPAAPAVGVEGARRTISIVSAITPPPPPRYWPGRPACPVGRAIHRTP